MTGQFAVSCLISGRRGCPHNVVPIYAIPILFCVRATPRVSLFLQCSQSSTAPPGRNLGHRLDFEPPSIGLSRVEQTTSGERIGGQQRDENEQDNKVTSVAHVQASRIAIEADL
ncbi:uncharacterized protein K460DRAFT_354050 [Cucurbitaria berberidis CBS 394.84]|uniref:Uncharacterized protein n=1 Tax=Cucurbitaria berberidis CBS 394.84 TaxID=1168544 RepID=A0A9P4LCH4_9PLEO|nr:uncharacterized protein K460DRAFT_354050 [Cucurbitaria berberidis CBS 394.84]KAF1849169.1 hypothetical protein K460DRAFT_354050 [Cucurbitaria berberidis CBS 394.84]